MDHRQLAGSGLALTGLVLAGVQVVHGLAKTDVTLALVFEAGPFALLAGSLVFAGVWFARTDWVEPDVANVVGWTTGGGLLFLAVAALVLFSQRLQRVSMATDASLAVDLLTVGLVAGVVVGLYDARNRRHTRDLADQRDRIRSFANTAADVNNYGRALHQCSTLEEVSALCIQGIQALLGLDQAAVLERRDGEFAVVQSSVAADQAALTRLAEQSVGGDRATVETSDDLPDSFATRAESVVTIVVTEMAEDPVVLVAIADSTEFADEQVQLLELLVAHAGTALDRIAVERNPVDSA
ncbi:hypothetical protein ACKVMT_03730 [Halobacteriales archaeon Cl-PHB]